MPKRKIRRRRPATARPMTQTFFDAELGFVELVYLAPGETCPTCDHHEEHR